MRVSTKLKLHSDPQVLCKKGLLENFEKFTGKHLCQSLYIKKEYLRKPFKNTFFIEYLRWLLLNTIKTKSGIPTFLMYKKI